jgi:hypothetical protein
LDEPGCHLSAAANTAVKKIAKRGVIEEEGGKTKKQEFEEKR